MSATALQTSARVSRTIARDTMIPNGSPLQLLVDAFNADASNVVYTFHETNVSTFYNIEVVTVDVIAAYRRVTDSDTIRATSVRQFTFATDLEKDCVYIPTRHHKTGELMRRAYNTRRDAVRVTERAWANGIAVQLTRKDIRAWCADIRGIDASVSTRDWMRDTARDVRQLNCTIADIEESLRVKPRFELDDKSADIRAGRI